MKQYLDQEQTAKLMGLGFEKPRTLVDKYYDFDAEAYAEVKTYSIGELIEMLPKSLKNSYNPPLVIECNEKWRVYYGVQADYSWEWLMWLEEERNELIDALYDMVIKLKEKGVI